MWRVDIFKNDFQEQSQLDKVQLHQWDPGSRVDTEVRRADAEDGRPVVPAEIDKITYIRVSVCHGRKLDTHSYPPPELGVAESGCFGSAWQSEIG